jgi:hypothetical protein
VVSDDVLIEADAIHCASAKKSAIILASDSVDKERGDEDVIGN